MVEGIVKIASHLPQPLVILAQFAASDCPQRCAVPDMAPNIKDKETPRGVVLTPNKEWKEKMEQEAKIAKEFEESWSAVYEGGPVAKRFPRNGNARSYRPLDADSEDNNCGVRHYNSKYGGWSAQQDYWGDGSSYRLLDVEDPPSAGGSAFPPSYRPLDVEEPGTGGSAASTSSAPLGDDASSWRAPLAPNKVREYTCFGCKEKYKHHDLVRSHRSKWLKCDDGEVKIGHAICYECEAFAR